MSNLTAQQIYEQTRGSRRKMIGALVGPAKDPKIEALRVMCESCKVMHIWPEEIKLGITKCYNCRH